MAQRAARVLPNIGHLDISGIGLPGYSQYWAHARGCRTVDVDGKVFIDYMCSFGPISLGHRHPAVDAAVAKQLEAGDCLPGPSESAVEV